jgi:hypothetical protein
MFLIREVVKDLFKSIAHKDIIKTHKMFLEIAIIERVIKVHKKKLMKAILIKDRNFFHSKDSIL